MDTKDIEKLMAELAEGSDMVIANPKYIEELENQGFPFEHNPPPTIDQGYSRIPAT